MENSPLTILNSSFKTCGYPRAKMKRLENSLTACLQSTYAEIYAYTFVDFRSKRACSSNYRRTVNYENANRRS